MKMPPPCTIKGNVKETSSSGSLDEGSGKVQHASTPIWQYSRICLCSEWSQFLRRSKCHRPAQSREMSWKLLPGGHWMKVPGRFKSEDLHCPVNVNERTGGKCQRRFFQGVPGGRFQESSESKRTYPLAVLPEIVVSAMVTVPSET